MSFDPSLHAKAQSARQALKDLISLRLDSSLQTQLFDFPNQQDAFLAFLSKVPKLLGNRPLIGQFGDRATAEIESTYGPLKVGEWSLALASRIYLLASYLKDGADVYAQLFQIYDLADTETKQACLSAINLMNGDIEQGLVLVHDAGRTYLSALMTSAWCNHPFSATYLSEHDYRKAVLKALFCDIPIAGFQKLTERATSELAQSVSEYADEREAAGRIVPPTVWILAAYFPKPGLVARLIGRIEHPSETERLTAIQALGNTKDQRAISFLEERLDREPFESIQLEIKNAIERLKSKS
jgi:HEAT repeat protein